MNGVAGGKPRAAGIVADGMRTGVILQLAVGPLFFFVVDLSIHHGFSFGLAATAAVTLADLIYIVLAIAGVGALLNKKSVIPYLRVVGSVVLGVFGLVYALGAAGIDVWRIVTGGSHQVSADSAQSGIASAGAAFAAAFILTISSPITILFWTGLFSTKIAERGYGRSDLYWFGLGALVCTPVFLSLVAFVFGLAGAIIPPIVSRVLNGTVGLLLLFYAVLRVFPPKPKKEPT